MRFASAMASWMAVTAPCPAEGFSLWHANSHDHMFSHCRCWCCCDFNCIDVCMALGGQVAALVNKQTHKANTDTKVKTSIDKGKGGGGEEANVNLPSPRRAIRPECQVSNTFSSNMTFEIKFLGVLSYRSPIVNVPLPPGMGNPRVSSHIDCAAMGPHSELSMLLNRSPSAALLCCFER